MSVQRTEPFCSAKSCVAFWSAVSAMPLLRIGLIAGRPDLQPVVAGRQVLDAVAALIVGEHADRDLGLGVAGLHEGAAERRAVRAR